MFRHLRYLHFLFHDETLIEFTGDRWQGDTASLSWVGYKIWERRQTGTGNRKRKETVRSKEMLTDRRQVYTEWPEHKSKHSYSRNKDMDTKIITPLQTTAKSANDKHPYVVSCVCRVPHPSLLSLSLCFKCTSFVLSLSPSVGPLPLIIQDFKKGDRRSPVSVDNMLNTHTLTSLYPSSCQTNLWFHKRLSCLLCQLLKSLGKRLITPTPEALWGK